jgi:hypothetical protein
VGFASKELEHPRGHLPGRVDLAAELDTDRVTETLAADLQAALGGDADADLAPIGVIPHELRLVDQPARRLVECVAGSPRGRECVVGDLERSLHQALRPGKPEHRAQRAELPQRVDGLRDPLPRVPHLRQVLAVRRVHCARQGLLQRDADQAVDDFARRREAIDLVGAQRDAPFDADVLRGLHPAEHRDLLADGDEVVVLVACDPRAVADRATDLDRRDGDHDLARDLDLQRVAV